MRWVPGARNAELSGRIVLQKPSFQDTFMVRVGSKTYVAGTEEVPNPEYAKQLQSIQLLAQRLDQTLRLVASLEGEMVLYDYEIQSLQVDIHRSPNEKRNPLFGHCLNSVLALIDLPTPSHSSILLYHVSLLSGCRDN